MRLRALLLAILVLPAAAAQGAQPEPQRVQLDVHDPTTLYFHLVQVQDFPINAQPPPAEWTEVAGYGGITPTLTCTGQEVAGMHTPYSTSRGYMSPDVLDYASIENGAPRIHPLRGVLTDVLVMGEPTLYWYLISDIPGPAVPPAVVDVRVSATWRAGSDISIDDRAYDAGRLLMHGVTEPVTLLGPQVAGGNGQVRYVGQLDGRWVYEFAVPIGIEDPIMPRSEGANLRVDVFLQNPYCSDPGSGYVMTGTLVPLTAEGFRPRMEADVSEPLRFEYLAPQWVGDDLVVHAGIVSPWGDYDIDRESLSFGLVGPTPATTLRLAEVPQRSQGHTYELEPARLTFVWPDAGNVARPGHYMFFLRAQNLQGSASLEGATTIQIGDVRELPAPAFPLLAAAACALAMRLRRR